MKLTYTPTREDDRTFFIQTHHAAYRDVVGKMFGWDEQLQDKLADKAFDEGNLYVIHHNNKAVGIAGWEEKEDHLWVKEVFLQPQYQGQGIGSQVVRDMLTKGRAKAKGVRLQALKENHGAKKLYERLGFTVDEATDTHWKMSYSFKVPTLETERLFLKPVTEADIPAYKKYFVDYEIIRHLSAAVPWPYPADGVNYFLNEQIFPYQGESVWLWGLFAKEAPGELIGAVHLWRKGKPEHRGFWLARPHHGKGLMTEAVAPINDFAFDELGFDQLIFSNAVGNIRSRRVKEKTGAQFWKVEPAQFIDPELTEHELWTLDAKAWKQRSSS